MKDFRGCHKQKAWGASTALSRIKHAENALHTIQNKGNHDLIWNPKLEDKRQGECDKGRERERDRKNIVCQIPTDAAAIWQIQARISPESNVLKLKNLPVHCLG